MFFNSLDFAVFLPIVFTFYWLINSKNLQIQNAFIVIASYVFYSWWDWRFLALILTSTMVDYAVGRTLYNENNHTKRKALLWCSILVNIGILAVFKYYNFFVENFTAAFSIFGTSMQPNTLNIILPVGISFYTFQTLSYTIDVYNRKLQPTQNFIAFAAFVSFFPQLVAGPIERATHLLPQFLAKRSFNYALAVDGLRQMLWGLFKKVVIADNCAIYVNQIFENTADYSGGTLLVGALFFTLQIYGDFSGYSDMAIGTAKLFGFNLKQNFNFPFFSRNMAEFWRRWHISLSTWFRDYVFIPLGGSKQSKANTIRNIFIVFIVSGFWHGANWTFIIWGGLHALYYVPLLMYKKHLKQPHVVAYGRYLPSIKEGVQILSTFALTVLAFIFFRAENLTHASQYICNIFTKPFLGLAQFNDVVHFKITAVLIVVFIIAEWLGREGQHALDGLGKVGNQPIRYCVYYLIIAIVLLFGKKEEAFIYFQF